jgi:SWI/SNF-related matrix-associated actin-dependent regulator 1 of chromatin subfamily A
MFQSHHTSNFEVCLNEGTPVQNSPKELMSLLCFLMPLFDRKTKSSKRKRGYDNDSDDDNDGGERMLEYFVQLEGGSDDAKAYRKLKQLFAPFVLRRKKEDVLSQILPPKTRQVDIVPMDEATQSAYNAIISSHVKARTEKGSGVDAQDAAAQKHLFTALRKAANHPLLLRNRFKSEEDKATLAHLALNYRFFGNDASCTLQLVRDELDKFSDYEIHCAAIHMIEENPKRREHLERYLLMEGDLFCSPKFVRLRTLLPELINKGHRVLIFSQWTKILDLMGHLLQALHMDNHLRLDGQTAVSERQDLIDQFTNDSSIPVFLLSTRAGGMGQ